MVAALDRGKLFKNKSKSNNRIKLFYIYNIYIYSHYILQAK